MSENTSTTEVTVQQPGTHRELVQLKWTEYVSYTEEVEIDVPDGYEGDLADLIEADDNPFTEGDVEGVPDGYVSNWLDRAQFHVEDVNDREFSEVVAVD